ncbi:MAG: hypothetical protein ABL878_19830 [Burkholderiales bacterium]
MAVVTIVYHSPADRPRAAILRPIAELNCGTYDGLVITIRAWSWNLIS